MTGVQTCALPILEYLRKLHKEDALDTSFTNPLGTIALHLPCHLKPQNLGVPARDVLSLVPDTKVVVVDQCSAHDGTWAMKKEYHEYSLKYGKKLFDGLASAEADHCAGDCPLAATQVSEAGVSDSMVHHIILLHRAYGIGESAAK